MQSMQTVVQKYGGSSVADVEKIRRVADHVVRTADAGNRVVVVVSAMGDTTDELLALARRVSPAPPRRELDMLISCGERISMALLAMAIAEKGREAISFTGSQSGIITDERHSGARIIEVRPLRIQEELDRGKIVIVAGFQGVSTKREVTTLGRGGSDTTAVALAAALGASYCEIFSDVEGVWTADPRHVPGARRLDSISYEEMFELAEHGARVLNQQAVEWARKAGITIHARKTGSDGRGTRVEASAGSRRVTGVASALDLVRLELRAGEAGALCRELAAHGIPVRQMHARAVGLSCLFALDDVPDWPRVRAALAAALPGLEIVEGLGTATVVGHGVGADAHTIGRAHDAARATGAEVRSVEATPLRITVVVEAERAAAVAAALHAELLPAG